MSIKAKNMRPVCHVHGAIKKMIEAMKAMVSIKELKARQTHWTSSKHRLEHTISAAEAFWGVREGLPKRVDQPALGLYP